MKWKPPFRGHSGTLAHQKSRSSQKPLFSPQERRAPVAPVTPPPHLTSRGSLDRVADEPVSGAELGDGRPH
jgi:hypothetical protein